MIDFLAVIYGLHLVALIYFSTFITTKGLLGSGGFPFYMILLKYFIYWKTITFGFSYLSMWGIVIGLISGIYISLPILYYINKKVFLSEP
jgi:preprotein translocase subunit SecF